MYVHIGGKIEALGKTGNKNTNNPYTQPAQLSIEDSNNNQHNNDNNNQLTNGDDPSTPMIGTVCIVDVRDNNPNDTESLFYKLMTLDSINFSKIPNTSSLGGPGGGPNNLNAAMTSLPYFNKNPSTLSNNNNNNFNPSNLLTQTGIPSQNMLLQDNYNNNNNGVGNKKLNNSSGGKKKNLKLLTGTNNNTTGSQSVPTSSSGPSGGDSQTKVIYVINIYISYKL